VSFVLQKETDYGTQWAARGVTVNTPSNRYRTDVFWKAKRWKTEAGARRYLISSWQGRYLKGFKVKEVDR
jgi:hypothetical protein